MIDLHTCDPRWLRIPFAVARRVAKSDEELFEELVSVGSIGLVQAAKSFDADKGNSPMMYLFNGVELRVRSHLFAKRRRRRNNPLMRAASLDQHLEANEFGDDNTLNRAIGRLSPPDRDLEALDDVHAALRGLDEFSRTALVLHYVCGFSHRETARFLGVKHWTVNDRIRQAKDAVREAVKCA